MVSRLRLMTVADTSEPGLDGGLFHSTLTDFRKSSHKTVNEGLFGKSLFLVSFLFFRTIA